MSIKWDLYKSRLEINGTSFKDRQVNSVVDAINSNFVNNPSYFEVSINGSETLTGVQVVDNSSNSASKIDYIRKIIMKPSDTISVGDIVEWNSKKWLVTTAEQFSDIYWYGMMQECNNTLKYYKNSVLFEVPIVIESGVRLYSLGQDSTKYINTLSDEIIVYASSTANIGVDDVYKIGRRNYKVMTVQDVLIDGLLVIKMEVTVEGVEEVEEPIIPSETGISVSPIDNFIYRNKTKVFTAKIFNNEAEDLDSRIVWIITNKDGTYNRYCEMSYDNRNCTLTASNESSHVGKVVILRVALESDTSIFIEKEITIKSLV